MPVTAKSGNKYYQRDRRRRLKLASKSAEELPPIPATPELQVEAVAKWSRDVLKIPAGHPNVGKPVILQDFQLQFLQGALSHREAVLSIARKNSKTSLVAILALSYLAEGAPLQSAGFRIGTVSVTLKLSKELVDLAKRLILSSKLDGLTTKLTPFPGTIRNDRWDSQLEALSADRASGGGNAYGLDLIVCDELGLFPESSRELLASCRGSLSAKDGRFVAISIQGDSPLMREMVSRQGQDTTYVQVHAGRRDAPLDDRANWLRANPGLGPIKSESYMRDMAKIALSSPRDQAMFRIQELNEPGRPEADMLVSAADWRECEVDELPTRAGPCYVGVDLGGSASMSSAVFYWGDTCRLEAYGAFPEHPSLEARSQSDGGGRTLYRRMYDEGSLRICGSRTVDVASFLGPLLADVGVRKITAVGCDRYRKAEFLEIFDELQVSLPIHWRGTGASRTADGSFDVRAFQSAVMERKIHARPTVLMRSALANTEVRYDVAGNPALKKSKRRSRIDVVSAGVIALGLSRLGIKRRSTGLKFWG